MQPKEKEPTKEECAALEAMRIFRDQGKYEDVLSIAEAAFSAGVKHAWFYIDASHAAAQLGKKDLALGYADAAIVNAGDKLKAHLSKAHVLILINCADEALSFFADYAASQPASQAATKALDVLQRTAANLKKLTRPDTKAYSGRALETQAECDEVLHSIYHQQDWSVAAVGAVLKWYQQHDTRDKAKLLLSDWMANAPDNPDVYVTSGAYWLGERRYKKARIVLEAGMQKHGYSKNATEMMSVILGVIGTKAEQEAFFDAWCREQPQEDSAFVRRGIFLMRHGRLEEAAPNYARAVTLCPQNNAYRFHYLFAKMELAQGDHEQLRALGVEFKKFAQPSVLSVPEYSYLAAKYHYQLRDFYAARRIMLPALKRLHQGKHVHTALSILYLATTSEPNEEGVRLIADTVSPEKMLQLMQRARRLRSGQIQLNDNDPESFRKILPGPKISTIYDGHDTAPVNRVAGRVMFNTRPDDPF